MESRVDNNDVLSTSPCYFEGAGLRDESNTNIHFSTLQNLNVVPQFHLSHFERLLSEHRTPPHVRTDVVKEGSSQGLVQDCTNIRNFENVFQVPIFQHSYPQFIRPLSEQYNDEAHKWLSSYGVDDELGPEVWKNFVQHRTPELSAYVYPYTDEKDCLWSFKYMAWIFVLDTCIEGNVESSNRIKAFEILLDHTLVVLWNDPENESTLKFLRPFLNDQISSTEEMKSLLQKCQSHLIDAAHKTTSLMDVTMGPLASAFRDLWIEYCEHVPAEFVVREAENLLSYFTGCLMEMYMDEYGIVIDDLNEIMCLRRATTGIVESIVCIDLFISRLKNPIPLIPNNIFYGPEMQCLLVAAADMMAWMNDIYSFHKDVIGRGEKTNLVLMTCHQYNCASYTEAGVIALKKMQGKVDEMEMAYDRLKAVAPSEFHPAIDIYITTCRYWVYGCYDWHIVTPRYNAAPDTVSDLYAE